MNAAFPFLAIIAGAVALIEHLKKLKEEGAQLAENEDCRAGSGYRSRVGQDKYG